MISLLLSCIGEVIRANTMNKGSSLLPLTLCPEQGK